MKKLDFHLALAFDDDADVTVEQLQALVNSAVLDAIPDAGTAAPSVDVLPVAVPKVLIVVNNGMAEIRAVDGAADIALVDQDKEGEELGSDEIDSLLAFDRFTGDSNEIETELASARAALEEYLSDEDGLKP